jgi:hypothetical protein
MVRSFLHELGHTGGIEHPWDSKNKAKDIHQGSTPYSDLSKELNQMIKNNLMNSDDNPIKELKSTKGMQVTNDQLNVVNEEVKED